MTQRQYAPPRFALRRVAAMIAALAVSLTGLLVVPATAGWASTGASLSLTSASPTTQVVGSRFEYGLTWGCSVSASQGCTDLVIEVPVTLTPRSGQIEDLGRWAIETALPAGSLAGFTRSVQMQGTQLTLRLAATRPIPAGTQESVAISVLPHAATGDGVSFTVGDARLTSGAVAGVTAAGIMSTVTNDPLPDPSIRVISGGQDLAGRGIVHYEILPKFDRVYEPGSGAWRPWRDVSNPAALTTVTAVDGTESVRMQLPAGATVATIAAGGVFDAQANAIVWANGSGVGNSPLQFTLSYDPGLNHQVVHLTGERVFTATNGSAQRAAISLPHRLQLVPNLTQPEYTKCGQGSAQGRASEVVAGQCTSSNYVTPLPAYNAGAGDWLQYKLSVTRLDAGDQLKVTDWAPCRTSPTADGFGSQAGCTDPLAWFTGFTLEARTAAGETRSTIVILDDQGNPIQTVGGGATEHSQVQAFEFEEVQVFRSDGQTVTLRSTTLSTLPVLPAGVRYVGFSGVTSPLQFPGIVAIVPRMQISPTIDRAMRLENTATWQLTRNGVQASETSTTGAAAIVQGVAGRAEASFLAPSGGSRPLRGTFHAYGLDPNLGLPVYVMELPEGYAPQGGGLSTLRMLHHSGQQVSNSLYDLSFVPEDRAAGTNPMIRAVPRPGTSAVPATAGEGWPLVTMIVHITPQTAAEFGSVEGRSWISVAGTGVQFDRCVSGSSVTFIESDPNDRDGDGVTGEDRFCRSTVARGNYPSTNAAAASVSLKQVRDAAGSEWFGGNTLASTPSGEVEYRIHWQNAGAESLHDIVLYDILPYPGDTGTVPATALTPRGSAFAPTFAGLSSSIPAGTTLEYSASSNPCRPELLAAPGCENDWSSDLQAIGAAQVRALKITLPGTRPTGSGYNLYYRMAVPAGTASGVTAWNSLASLANHRGSPLAAAETAKVGIRMPAEVTVAKHSAADGGVVAVGDQISYTLTARNELESTVHGVTLTDDLSEVLRVARYEGDARASTGDVTYDAATGQLHWIGSLQPGETASITYSVTATAASERVVNRVTGVVGELATNCENGQEAGCFVETTVHLPSLQIEKHAVDVAAGAEVEANSTLQWEYRVRNTGTEPIDRVLVSDDRGVQVSCPVSELAVGDRMTCVGFGSVGTASPYTNRGTVTGVGAVTGSSASASATWSANLIPLTTRLSLDKFAEEVPEGSLVRADRRVEWTYLVTNTGTDRLTQLSVVDDQGVVVSCPVTELEPGASAECVGSGSVGLFGPYQNIGTATAVGHFTAGVARGSDSWSVRVDPYTTGVVVEKTAPAVSSPTVRPGTVVEWDYAVTNTGEEELSGVVVSDDRGVQVSCPADVLAPGAVMNCTGSGSVGDDEGLYTNIGAVTATTVRTATAVSAEDAWSVQVRELVPALTLAKGALNARAGEATPAMHEVHWQYTVTNSGEEPLTGLAVVDDQGVVVSCPATELAVGESVTCVGSGHIGAGDEYTNVATATATGQLTDGPVTGESRWSVPVEAAELGLVVAKSAPEVPLGASVLAQQRITWHYSVTNTGREPILDLEVTDDQGVEVSCPRSDLAPQATIVCVGSGVVGAAGSYTNVGEATGRGDWSGRTVRAADSWTVAVLDAPTTTNDPNSEPDSPLGRMLAITGASQAAVVLLLSAGLLLLAGGIGLRRRRN